MAKRRQRSYRVSHTIRRYDRRAGNREPRQTVLIACEGKKTETIYFQALKRDLRLGSVAIRRGEGGDCCKTVRTAIKIKQEGNYDQYWCVFETEAASNAEDLQSAIQLAHEHRIGLAISNPAFEYWLLLHFTCRDRPFRDAQDVIDELRDHLPEYQKNFDVYLKLREHTQTAVANARIVLERHSNITSREFPNPSTHVHELVEELYKLKVS